VKVRKGQFLTDTHKKRRVAWCEHHAVVDTDFASWTFSDEKWWRVGGINERIWVDITDQDPDERYVPTQAQACQGDGVAVWGAISYHGRNSLHFFDGSLGS
jgi:hypothetical protein